MLSQKKTFKHLSSKNTKQKRKTKENKTIKTIIRTETFANNTTCPSVSKCAPGLEVNVNSCSCFSRDALKRIVKAWNDNNPSTPIKIMRKMTDKEIWGQIHEKLKSTCADEMCWTEQPFLNSQTDLKERFRPEMPDSWNNNMNQWLNTDDIKKVMNQYEVTYPNFEFIGPVPIDFDKTFSFGQCVADELCKIDLNKLKHDKINKIGIIFNLDPHDKPGSHWVSMFIDMVKKQIYYFDSYGMAPPKEIVNLIERIKSQSVGYASNVNTTRHQYKNSECGMYSMYFIARLLEGYKYENMVNNRISDDLVNKYRKIFYNA